MGLNLCVSQLNCYFSSSLIMSQGETSNPRLILTGINWSAQFISFVHLFIALNNVGFKSWRPFVTDMLMFLIITHHMWSELELILTFWRNACVLTRCDLLCWHTLTITTSTCQRPKLDHFHCGNAEPVLTPVWLLCRCDSF